MGGLNFEFECKLFLNLFFCEFFLLEFFVELGGGKFEDEEFWWLLGEKDW